LIQELAALEYRLSLCASDRIQLGALVAIFCLAPPRPK
jgi:hypothetical protein